MKEIIEAFAARIKSPIGGYFAIAWIAFNWRPLFYLFFSNTSIDDRLRNFDKLTDNYSLVLFPLAAAATAALSYPWINLAFTYLCKKPADLRNSLQAESEHKLLMKKKQLEEARSFLLATKEKDLIGRAKRDQEVLSISDNETKERLRRQIEDLRKQIDNNNNSLSYDKSKYDLAHSFKQMADLLTKQGNFSEAQEYLTKAINMQEQLDRQKNFEDSFDEATKAS